MNILILTAKCGMGHYSVSTSLKEQLDNKDVNVEIYDLFKVAFPRMQTLIYGTFNFLVSKCSKVYNFFYKFSANDTSAPLKSFVGKKIEKLIESKSPDIIISTFPVCSKYISAYKKQRNKDIKLYTYITDINVNKEWITDKTDGYFVASEDTKEQLLNHQINSSKIKVVGIPVKNEFKKKLYKEERNEILIMGGGLGLISFMDKEIEKLLLNKDIHITLITGKNQKLFDKYHNRFDNLTVIKYTNEVYKYMERASLIISKAGRSYII